MDATIPADMRTFLARFLEAGESAMKAASKLVKYYKTIDNRDYVKWIGNGKIYPRYV